MNYQQLGSYSKAKKLGFGEIGTIAPGLTASVAGCPGAQSLAAQAINRSNSGQHGQAESLINQSIATATKQSHNPQCGYARGQLQQIQMQIMQAKARSIQGGAAAAPKAAPKAAADDGVSGQAVGNVLTGIGAILNPLAQAGVGIFQAQQMASLEKARLKAQQQQAAIPQMPLFIPPAPARRSNTPIIIAAAVGGLAVVGTLIFVLSK